MASQQAAQILLNSLSAILSKAAYFRNGPSLSTGRHKNKGEPGEAFSNGRGRGDGNRRRRPFWLFEQQVVVGWVRSSGATASSGQSTAKVTIDGKDRTSRGPSPAPPPPAT